MASMVFSGQAAKERRGSEYGSRSECSNIYCVCMCAAEAQYHARTFGNKTTYLLEGPLLYTLAFTLAPASTRAKGGSDEGIELSVLVHDCHGVWILLCHIPRTAGTLTAEEATTNRWPTLAGLSPDAQDVAQVGVQKK